MPLPKCASCFILRKNQSMARTSIIHYIEPSSVSIVPNANGLVNDLAVYAAEGARIKVYSPRAGIGLVDDDYQEWSLTGRNRRLADDGNPFVPFTIYARLTRRNKNYGYIVFAPQKYVGGEWLDKYPSVTADGYTSAYYGEDDTSYYYIRLGEVSAPVNNLRDVDFDTGILGTDNYNNNWALNPDSMPLRIEVNCTVNGEEAGPTPYVYWEQTLVLTAMLTEGWTGTNIQRFDHWEIRRDTGNTEADNRWNAGAGAVGFQSTGVINLMHGRGGAGGVRDDFNGVVNATFTIIAMGFPEGSSDSSSSSSSSSGEELVVLDFTSINIMAETWEKYELALSSSIVSYNPQTDAYSPDDGVTFNIRATDQRGKTSLLTYGQVGGAGLVVEYAAVDSSSWTAVSVSGSAVAVGKIAKEVFYQQQSINVRLRNAVPTELHRATIAFLRDGEDSKEREWIFLRSAEPITFGDSGSHIRPALIVNGEVNPPPNRAANGNTPYDNTLDEWVPQGWWDEQQGVDEEHPYEYGAYRDFLHDEGSSDSSSSDDGSAHGHWGAFSEPRLWNHYGATAVVYEIIPNVSVITADDEGNVTTGEIIVAAYKTVGNERSEDILYNNGAGGEWYVAQYSIDGGAWTDCTVSPIIGTQNEYKVYIPAAVVRTVMASLGLRLTNNDGEVLAVCSDLPVVNNGADAYAVAANPASVSFNCNAAGICTETGAKTVELNMYKGANPKLFTASIVSTSHCAAALNGTNLQIQGVTSDGPYDLSQGGRVTVLMTNGTVTRSLTIPVSGNRQGPGGAGTMLYPAGAWTARAYSANGDARPYVLYEPDGRYYYLSADSAAATDVPGTSGKWTLMTQVDVIYAKFGIMDYGKMASAIFCGDWMYSEYGKLYTSASNYYIVDAVAHSSDATHWKYDEPYTVGNNSAAPFGWFDPAYPQGGSANTFAPVWAVNLLTGKSYQDDTYIRGEVYAETGVFKGFVRKKKTTITVSNQGQYVRIVGTTIILDFDKCGSFIELELGVFFDKLSLPLLSAYVASQYTTEQKDDIRSYVGTKMIIYNKTGHTFNILLKMDASGGTTSTNLANSKCAELECKMGCDTDDTELIYWSMNTSAYIA